MSVAVPLTTSPCCTWAPSLSEVTATVATAAADRSQSLGGGNGIVVDDTALVAVASTLSEPHADVSPGRRARMAIHPARERTVDMIRSSITVLAAQALRCVLCGGLPARHEMR